MTRTVAAGATASGNANSTYRLIRSGKSPTSQHRNPLRERRSGTGPPGREGGRVKTRFHRATPPSDGLTQWPSSRADRGSGPAPALSGRAGARFVDALAGGMDDFRACRCARRTAGSSRPCASRHGRERRAAPSRCCWRGRCGSAAADGRSSKQSRTIAAARCCSRPHPSVRGPGAPRLLLLSPGLRRRCSFATPAVVIARYSFSAEQSWEGFRYRIPEERSPAAVAAAVAKQLSVADRPDREGRSHGRRPRRADRAAATTRRQHSPAAAGDCRLA